MKSQTPDRRSASFAARLLGLVTGRRRRGKQPERTALPAGTDTKVDQTLDEVLARIRGDGAKRVLVSGDRGFLAAVRASAPELQLDWASCLLEDVKAGASNPDLADFAAAEAVVCGGAEAGTSFRHAAARMADIDRARPVHWVASDWEFCAGTLPVPTEADDAEALLYNHFQHYFGIKDPLQFRVEIYHGDEVKHFYRILQPNESIVIRLSDHFSKRSKPCCIAVFVAHPILTRGRHYRLRVCADVFWRDSFTTLHSSHEFKRSPNHKFEFRASKELVRSGEIVLTIPNYARDVGEDRNVTLFGGITESEVARDPKAYIEEVKLARNGGREPFFGWKYRGYGGSFWYSFEGSQACSNGHSGSLSANHHASVPVAERSDWSSTPEEIAELAQLKEAGFMVEPFGVPMDGSVGDLAFGFDFDSSNPQFNHFRLYYFDGSGAYLGEMAYEKRHRGAAFPDEIVRQWGDPKAAQARLCVVTPDWQQIRIRRKGFKLQSDLIVANRRTGDRDVTEFQNCWRNCGVIVPGMPHFVGPAAMVVGRTNLFGRARIGDGYRTAVLAVNGSGSLTHRRSALMDISVRNRSGEAMSADIEIKAFDWRLIWLDELMPTLASHVGGSGVGALAIGSKDADVNCQIVTTNAAGAVSLQHLWGY